MSVINALPALTGGFVFSTSGIRYNGKNYYEFPYDQEQKPSIKAVENIISVVEDMQREGLKVKLVEQSNTWYQFKVLDADDETRVIRDVDAHMMIMAFIQGGTQILEQVLNPDKRYSF